jgi:hypothetical protein
MFSGFRSLRKSVRWRICKGGRLVLPIDDIETVKVLQGAKKLSSIKPTPILIELPLPLQMIKQFTSVDYKRSQGNEDTFSAK